MQAWEEGGEASSATAAAVREEGKYVCVFFSGRKSAAGKEAGLIGQCRAAFWCGYR